ncbi:MAG: hypothetical protein AB7G28_06965 [Pirellulales bacterium]
MPPSSDTRYFANWQETSVGIGGAYSIALCGVFAQYHGRRVGLTFKFVVTAFVAATVTAWANHLPKLSI